MTGTVTYANDVESQRSWCARNRNACKGIRLSQMTQRLRHTRVTHARMFAGRCIRVSL